MWTQVWDVLQQIYIIEDLILRSQDPEQLLQEMYFLRWLSMMLLYTDRDLESLCNPLVRKGINDVSVILDAFLDRFGTNQQRRYLPVHPDPGVCEARLATATSGGSEHINGRKCGDLGGMLCFGDIGCVIVGNQDDTDIGGDSSGHSDGGTCN